MTEQEQFACTLTPDDEARREAQVNALAGRLHHAEWHTDRHAVLDFSLGAESLVHEFVRDESVCCSFFEFGVTRAPNSVELHVSAPAGAEGMLEGLVGTFEGHGTAQPHHDARGVGRDHRRRRVVP